MVVEGGGGGVEELVQLDDARQTEEGRGRSRFTPHYCVHQMLQGRAGQGGGGQGW